MAEVNWHVEAASDLAAAAEFTGRIVAAVERLGEHPKMGRVVPEIGDDSYRELLSRTTVLCTGF